MTSCLQSQVVTVEEMPIRKTRTHIQLHSGVGTQRQLALARTAGGWCLQGAVAGDQCFQWISIHMSTFCECRLSMDHGVLILRRLTVNACMPFSNAAVSHATAAAHPWTAGWHLMLSISGLCWIGRHWLTLNQVNQVNLSEEHEVPPTAIFTLQSMNYISCVKSMKLYHLAQTGWIVYRHYQMMMSYFKGTADAVREYCTAVSCLNAPNTF